jgi:TP901 family phage tail tape measure protein
MPASTNIESRLKVIIAEMDSFVQKSGPVKVALKDINNVIGQLEGGKTVAVSVERLNRALENIKRFANLKPFGNNISYTSEEVKSLVKELEKAINVYAQFRTDVGRSARSGVTPQAAVGNLQTRYQQRFENLVKQQYGSVGQGASAASIRRWQQKVFRDLENETSVLRQNMKEQEKKVRDQWEKQNLNSMFTGVRPQSTSGNQIADKEFFQQLPLGARAVDNLQKKLRELGLSTPEVTKNVTELGSGITTLRFRAVDPVTGSIRQFTAHIDKSGKILTDTQKRFRSFGSAIARDTIEVLKWTIAVGLIYGPIRKLNELIEQSIKLEADLVDVQIALGGSQTNLNNIFSASADIARETSSSIEGVIEGYSEAYAAAGSVAQPAERAATANALLRDSMVLSKLSGLDQAKSLDTLVGALRQAGLELYDGYKLIDQWVIVSKNANVTLDQLASAFAIVGTAAEDVGITFEELNAMVATLAEATKLSADESGNAIRGFISGFQSASAEQTLAKFGIAVRNLKGEVRDFPDLLQQIALFKQEGVLSEREVAEITNVIGGGFRRGAQLATLMENYGRMQGLIAVQEDAQGQAAQALGLKMGTLESSIQRLSNAFSELGYTLGTDGGVLSGLSGALELITGLVSAMNALVGSLGAAAPLLATMGAGSLMMQSSAAQGMLGSNIPAFMAMMSPNARHASMLARQGVMASGQMQQFMASNPSMPGLRASTSTTAWGTPQTTLQLATWGEFIRNLTTQFNTGMQGMFANLGRMLPGALGRGVAGVGNLGLGGIAAPLLISGTQAAGGDYAKAGTSLAGGFLGAVVSGGNPIFAALGSVAASGFYDGFMSYEAELSERWASLAIEAARNAGLIEEGPAETTKTAEQELQDSLGFMEEFRVATSTQLLRLFRNIEGIVPGDQTAISGIQVLPSELGGTTIGDLEGQLEKDDVMTYLLGLQTGGAETWVDKFFAGGWGGTSANFDADTIKKAQEFQDEFMKKAIDDAIVAARVQQLVISGSSEVAGVASDAAQELITKSIEDLSAGSKDALSQYQDYSTITGALTTSTAQMRTAFDLSQGRGLGIPTPSPKEAIDFYVGLTGDEKQVMTQITGDILTLTEELEMLENQNILSDEDKARIREINTELGVTIEQLSILYPALQQATLLREAEMTLKPVIDMPDSLDPENLQEVIERAEAFWDDVLRHSGMTEEQIEAYKEAQKDSLIRANMEIIGETNIPSEYLNQATEDMGIGQSSNWSFVDLRDRVGEGQFGELMARYQQIIQAFEANVPGFELEADPTTLILKEGFRTLDLDMRLFNLAMNELIEIEKEKQVEGMFNLPGGSTFYVPFRAAELDANSRANDDIFDPSQWDFPTGGEVEQGTYKGAYEGIVAGVDTLTKAIPDAETGALGFKTLDEMVKDMMLQWTGAHGGYDFTSRDEYYESLNMGPRGATVISGSAGKPLADKFFDYVENFGTTERTLGEPRAYQELFSKLMGVASGTLNQTIGGDKTQDFFNWTNEFRDFLRIMLGGTAGTGIGFGAGAGSSVIPEPDEPPPEPPKVETQLNLGVTSNIQLQVDGRTLADIVKPYLHEDLLKYDSAGGSVDRQVVI